jgi:hypothetical protein
MQSLTGYYGCISRSVIELPSVTHVIAAYKLHVPALGKFMISWDVLLSFEVLFNFSNVCLDFLYQIRGGLEIWPWCCKIDHRGNFNSYKIKVKYCQTPHSCVFVVGLVC